MRFGAVDIPAVLIRAQEEGKLVIFAGAGVSMALPANLPDYGGLAQQIAAKYGHRKKINKNKIESELGKIHDQVRTDYIPYPLHKTCAEILQDYKLECNQLHRDILQLFGTIDQLRLVTTNFDQLFSVAAEQLGWPELQEFNAPALPLGRDFKGIIHLHGSIRQEPKYLVLIDRDFSRAYLTDGYARKFLLDLFANYYVMFIGYSHKDSVMEYLARGLVREAEPKRFALVKEDEKNDDWERRGIIPIKYPLSSGPEKERHAALSIVLSRWSSDVKLSAIEKDRKIKEIVTGEIPEDPEKIDYIIQALKKPETTRYFTRHAKKPNWLLWAARTLWDRDDKDSGLILENLFKPGRELSDPEAWLVQWFTEKFMLDHPEEAFFVIQEYGSTLNNSVRRFLADNLWRKHYRNPIDPVLLGRWLTIITNSDDFDGYQLTNLLGDLELPSYKSSFLLLLEYLTKPRINLQPTLSIFHDKESEDQNRRLTDVGVHLPQADSHFLGEIIREKIIPNLQSLVGPLLSMVTSHLTLAHTLQMDGLWWDDFTDSMSRSRSAIEEHPQNRKTDATHCLVDLAREVLDWYLKNDPPKAGQIIDYWTDLKVPLLKRLAVYGMTHRRRLKPEKKIEWLLNQNWLYKSELKHEAFQLLKITYPKTGQDIRKRLIESALKGNRIWNQSDPEELQNWGYEIFNLLSWLNQADPECNLIKKELSKIKQKHPKWGIGRFPDLGSYSETRSVGSQSPMSVDELLRQDPTNLDFIKFLTEFEDDHIKNIDRRGLEMAIAEACSQNPDWGLLLLNSILKQEHFLDDIGRGIFGGFERTSLTNDNWRAILTDIKDHSKLIEIHYIVSRILREGTRGGTGSIPDDLIGLAEKAAFSFTKLLLISDQEISTYYRTAGGQISRPISPSDVNTGTYMAEFWLQVISKKRMQAEGQWKGIPYRYKKKLREILLDNSNFGMNAKITIGKSLAFLDDIDPLFVKRHIFPLMDFQEDYIDHSNSLWAGHLWEQFSIKLMYKLREYYPYAFQQLRYGDRIDGEALTKRVARICIDFPENPLDNGWLDKFIIEAQEEDLEMFNSSIFSLIERAQIEQISKNWRKWVADYWTQRTKNRPRCVTRGEAGHMLTWLLPFKSYFEEMVDKVIQMDLPLKIDPREVFFTGNFFKKLITKNIHKIHPKATCQLFGYLIRNELLPFWGIPIVGDALESMKGDPELEDCLLEVRNGLLALGYEIAE